MLEWIVRGLKKNNQNEQKIRFEITETSLAAIGENHSLRYSIAANMQV